MTDSKTTAKPGGGGRTMVRLAMWVSVPIDLPDGCALEVTAADDGEKTVGLPSTPDALIAMLQAIKASEAHRDAYSALVGCRSYLADTRPEFTTEIQELPDFPVDKIAEYLNVRS